MNYLAERLDLRRASETLFKMKPTVRVQTRCQLTHYLHPFNACV